MNEGEWAGPVKRLTGGRNVGGRRVTGPIQGFGRMWQKVYRVDLGDAATPVEVIKTWREHFAELWPDGSNFYAPLTGIAPGEVAGLDLALPGRMRLSTGVLVLYADDESFTLMTPEGHQFAGWITFSAAVERGRTIAQALVLMRASDPLYELALAFGGQRMEDRFWEHTLEALAARFGVTAHMELRTTCVDRRRQWRRAGNIWHNAAIRSVLAGVRGKR